MTVEQAFQRLNKVFPGKLAYVQAMRWSRDGKVDEHYTFSVCVYDVVPKNANECGSISGDSTTSLTEAVDRCLANRHAESIRDAEAMFEHAMV